MKKVLISFLVLCVFVLTCGMAEAAPEKKRIMIYGDSNTFGWATDAQGKVTRLPAEVRWPEKMGTILGDEYEIIVEGLGGRTTNVDSPLGTGPGVVHGVSMNGAGYLPAALASHTPLDLVIIMLGTNDLKVIFKRTAVDIAMGIGELISIVTNGQWQYKTPFAVPKVLVLCPPKVNDKKESPYQKAFAGALERTEALPGILEPIAKAAGAHFFDVAKIVPFGEAADAIHFTPENHAAVAKAVADEVKKIFAK
ncbi:SGNH/GDSL hydrolase family protein [Mailhella sp.]|uniref:SGNH/GDSL hydrolase family protein n=1 Tax=Mailhella sp. TaxID=1981029 RepID=UPI004063861F